MVNKIWVFLKDNIRYLFLGGYISIEFIRFGGSIDFNQFLFYYLSIVNAVVCIYILLNIGEYKAKFKLLFSNIFIYMYGGFVIWGLLSYFYAINTSEVLIKSATWISSFLVFFNIFILFKKEDFKKVAFILSALLVLEVYSSFSMYWEIIKYLPYDFSNNSLLRGVTGNRNLTALIFCLKIPFVVYIIKSSKNKYLKLVFYSILIWVIYTLLLLGSRSSYVYFAVAILISVIYSYLVNKKSLIMFLRDQHLLYSFIGAFLLFSLFIGNNNSASIYNRVSSIDFQETSTQTRLRFYSHGINHIKNNIFKGVGLGNWKIKSIEYDSQNMNSYIVPFYLHNDFLEVGTELGIAGLLLYLGIFIYILIKLLLMILKEINNNGHSFPLYILFLSIIVYFVDSNLNFPHGRAISQVTFNILLAITLLNLLKYEKK